MTSPLRTSAAPPCLCGCECGAAAAVVQGDGLPDEQAWAAFERSLALEQVSHRMAGSNDFQEPDWDDEEWAPWDAAEQIGAEGLDTAHDVAPSEAPVERPAPTGEDALYDALTASKVAKAQAHHAMLVALLALHDDTVRELSRSASTGQPGKAPRGVQAAVERRLALHLGGTSRLGQGQALGELRDALRLREQLPLTLAGLATGAVWVEQAKVLIWETKHCSPSVTSEVERRVFAAAGETECPSDLRRRVRHDVLAVEAVLEPGATAERERTALERRTARRTALPDGMSGHWSTCTAEKGVAFEAAMDHLVAAAKAQDERDGVIRTAEQRRSDVHTELPGRLLALQAGGAEGAVPAPRYDVFVHTPMATALGLSEEPGYLEGYGPVSAAHVRRLLPSAHLRQVAVDQLTGRPIDIAQKTVKPCKTHQATRDALLDMLRAAGEWVVDDTPEPQYTPSARLSRFIKLRDMRCPAPGCGQRACRCDDEHLIPYAQGGPTSAANTGPVSRRCHNAKTHDGWTYTRHEDGSCTWTAANGRAYRRPAFWRPPPGLGRNPTLRPPYDPALIGDTSPRGPTDTRGLFDTTDPAAAGDCPSEGVPVIAVYLASARELGRRELGDVPKCRPAPRPPRSGTVDWSGGFDPDDPDEHGNGPVVEGCPF